MIVSERGSSAIHITREEIRALSNIRQRNKGGLEYISALLCTLKESITFKEKIDTLRIYQRLDVCRLKAFVGFCG